MSLPLNIAIPLVNGSNQQLSLGKDSIIFIVGPNGSGKSALVSQLAQIIPGDQFRRISAHRQNWLSHEASTLSPADRINMRNTIGSWERNPISRFTIIAP